MRNYNLKQSKGERKQIIWIIIKKHYLFSLVVPDIGRYTSW